MSHPLYQHLQESLMIDVIHIVWTYYYTNDVALVMLVKNDMKTISQMLSSIKDVVQSYLICDCRPTYEVSDGTDTVIRAFMKEHHIRGEVIHRPFTTFGESKTYLLEQARLHPLTHDASYFLLAESDQQVQLTQNVDLKSELDKHKLPVFHCMVDTLNYSHWMPMIVRNCQLYRYKESVYAPNMDSVHFKDLILSTIYI